MERQSTTHNSSSHSVAHVPGVIDTIGAGFSALIARPWIILAPVLLDLYLWLGLRVTADPVFGRAADWLRGLDTGLTGLANLINRQGEMNLMEFLSFRLPTIRLPTLFPLLLSEEPLRFESWDPVLELSSSIGVIVVILASMLVSYLLGAEYLRWLRSVSRGEEHRPVISATIDVATQLLIGTLLAIGLLLLIALPMLAGQIVFVLADAGVSQLMTALAFLPASFGFVLFYFAAHAIGYDRLRALESYRASYRIVRAYPMQSIGLIAATILVTSAFPFLWGRLLDNPAGVVLALIANSFFATGMFVSAMIFYHDRAASTPSVLER